MSSISIMPNCPVCDSPESKPLYRVNYTSQELLRKLDIESFGPCFLNRCIRCKHHYILPQLKSELLIKYYNRIDSEFYNKERLNVVTNPYPSYISPSIPELVQIHRKPGKLLEIGCGQGFLLQEFVQSGWKCFGVDPSPSASDFATQKLNLNVICDFFHEGVFSGEVFDVILLIDVIEHLQKPVAILKAIANKLNTNGLLIIGTGNICSLNSRISKQKWAYFGSYEHISFFSSRSITKLLNRTGFHAITINKTSYSGKRIANLIRILKNIALVLLNKIQIKKVDRIPLAHDHLLVLAEKK